jgi:stress-induced morphogen
MSIVESNRVEPRWEAKRTDETRMVENLLRSEFAVVDAYRHNSASIRVRVIDPRFEGKSIEERDDMVDTLLRQMPEETQADIIMLVTLAPTETKTSFQKSLANQVFEDPSPTML